MNRELPKPKGSRAKEVVGRKAEKEWVEWRVGEVQLTSVSGREVEEKEETKAGERKKKKKGRTTGRGAGRKGTG
jgi:hypothetical protein